MRVIGGVHGKIDQYLKIASQAKYSLQVGDKWLHLYRLGDISMSPNMQKGHMLSEIMNEYTAISRRINNIDTTIRIIKKNKCVSQSTAQESIQILVAKRDFLKQERQALLDTRYIKV